MPLKIIWALLDLVTLIVLGSGLYLWAARLRLSPSRQAEILLQNLSSRVSESGRPPVAAALQFEACRRRPIRVTLPGSWPALTG
jgi:uncharacterized iron-regulated membrane protein